MKKQLFLALLLAAACDDARGERECSLAGFVDARRSCTSDSECAIVGTCSGAGFYAVNVRSKDEAQQRANKLACVFDGPTYSAMCERGRCVARPDGAYCGGVDRDCARGEELYSTSCDDPKRACFRRCESGSSVCGEGFQCVPRMVAPMEGCAEGLIERALCAPAPDCEVLLSIDSEGKREVRRLPGGTLPIRLSLFAQNLTSEPKTLSYRHPCPGGPRVTGLPAGFDLWNACNAGACEATTTVRLVTLAPGERVPLHVPVLETAENACNPSALAIGTYTLGFRLDEVTGARVCGPQAFQLDLR